MTHPAVYTAALSDPARVVPMPALPYHGRFAPSPSGPLHLGSLVAALASWLDARAAHGTWQIRIEDVDTPRCLPGMDALILQQLAAMGLQADGDILWQSQRGAAYTAAFEQLQAAGLIYGCACTRREIADSQVRAVGATHTPPYPGTCRHGPRDGRAVRAWRIRVPEGHEEVVQDRCAGSHTQVLSAEVGDFILKRADGLWAYQLAVVVDDQAQGITDVVRGADLLESTARQQWLHRVLGGVPPRTLHVPVVQLPDGRKLSKQNGAPALDQTQPLAMLMQAWAALGFAPLPPQPDTAAFLAAATPVWAARFPWPGQAAAGVA